MNILVTGAYGQLGNEIKSIFDTGKSAISELPDEYIKGHNVRYVDIDTVDISDLDAVLKLTKEISADIIINCAAYTNVDACEENFDTAMRANAIGPRNLSIAAEQLNAKLIHVSTDYVFAGNGDKPYVEWDNKNPQGIYGKSKSLGEEYVKQFCSRYFIVRTAWLYGLVGKNFVKTMLRLGKEKDSIKVVNDQKGNPTNAADLAHHIVKLAFSEFYGVYHCTCKGECTWYDFTKKIFEYASVNTEVKPCASEEFKSPTKRPEYSSLDNMMLRCSIGDDTRHWEDALKDYIEKLKERGEL